MDRAFFVNLTPNSQLPDCPGLDQRVRFAELLLWPTRISCAGWLPKMLFVSDELRPLCAARNVYQKDSCASVQNGSD